MKTSKARYLAKKKFETLKECENCGSKKNLVRHHEDYNLPEKIKVFCRKCHGTWHHNNKALNMDKDKGISTIIRFCGKKEEKLFIDLKVFCINNNKTINGTLLELVERLLEEDGLILDRESETHRRMTSEPIPKYIP